MKMKHAMNSIQYIVLMNIQYIKYIQTIYDEYSEIQRNDYLLSCPIGQVSVFSNYISGSYYYVNVLNGEMKKTYNVPRSTEFFHENKLNSTYTICSWNSDSIK